jgi:hypothetical protein
MLKIFDPVSVKVGFRQILLESAFCIPVWIVLENGVKVMTKGTHLEVMRPRIYLGFGYNRI